MHLSEKKPPKNKNNKQKQKQKNTPKEQNMYNRRCKTQ